MNRRTFAVLLIAAAPVVAQEKKPNLSGRWEGSGMVELIDHREPNVIITTTRKDPRGESTSVIKLTTNGAENVNVMNGHEFRTRSRWDGDKLVTNVKGMGGLELNEVRFLSKGGKTQSVETYMGEPAGEPQQKRVMTKQAGK